MCACGASGRGRAGPSTQPLDGALLRVTNTLRPVTRATAAAGLSLVTLTGIFALSKLAYTPTRVIITDALAMPGGMVGSAGGIMGIYEIPSGAWAITCVVANFAFYALIWWLLVSLVSRPSSKTNCSDAPSNNRSRGPE